MDRFEILMTPEHRALRELNPAAYAHAAKLLKMALPRGAIGRTALRPEEESVYSRQNKREPYFETSRQFGVFVMPQMTEDELYELYPWDGRLLAPENMWMLPIVCERVGFLVMEYQGVQYLMQELDKSSYLTSKMTALERIKMMQFDRPALVKNALNIIRTLSTVVETDYKVLVKGSRATHAGGQWMHEVAIYALRKAKRVEFDLYDPHEEPGTETIRFNSGTAVIRRRRGKYEGDGSEYLVSIDDSWATTEQPGDRAPRSKYYSIKKTGNTVDPFFHSREGRVFSHPPVADSDSPCSCELCCEIHNFSSGADAVLVKKLMVSLGAHTCNQDVWADELKMRHLLLNIRAGAVKRDQVPDRLVRLLQWHQQISVTPTRIMQGEVTHRVNPTGYLKGRKVVFVGVPPSVLGEEPYEITRSIMSYDRHVDAVLVTDHVSGVCSTSAREIWATTTLPGYDPTGRSIGQFNEYIRSDKGGHQEQVAILVYGFPFEKLYDPKKKSNISRVFLMSQRTPRRTW